MLEANQIMFEIYREESYNRRYKVVYFTELTDHNKETEINRAMAGEHYFDGFLREYRKDEAKAIINCFLEKMNRGEQIPPEQLEQELQGYLAK
jgi:hypothetical protein